MQSGSRDFVAAAALSRRLLVVAGVLGLVAAGLLWLYLNRFEREVSGGRRVRVLSIAQSLKRGALIDADALAVTEVPVAYLEPRAVRASDRSKILGVPTAHALDPQDTLMWTDLSLSAERRELSSLVRPGKRAVTVRASEMGSDAVGSGLVRPGDYVDVLVTLSTGSSDRAEPASVVLLQRVLVLAVGSETQPSRTLDGEGRRGRRQGERELTLSLEVEEVQLLSLARVRGTLSVALRDPGDTKILEGIADMPLSVLYDKPAREQVQHRRPSGGSKRPVRLTEGTP